MKVVVGFLHRADAIAPLFRRSLTMLLVRDARTRRRIIGELDQESSANISAGRCQIVSDFLAHPDKPDWLWMVDSDMTFGPDILDRLLVTGQTGKPIVGGLCFGVRPVKVNGREQFNAEYGTRLEAFPTAYTFGEGGMVPMWDYPRGEVIRVGSTGAACLLMHRDVLADRRWLEDGHPLPWFRESTLGDKVVSEDQRFCIVAGKFGYPIHVDTHARTGHVKPVVIDESFYDEHRS